MTGTGSGCRSLLPDHSMRTQSSSKSSHSAPESDAENDILKTAKAALLAESDSLRLAADRLGDPFVHAVELIYAHSGKVIVTGVGKSADIGRKITSTLCSTGTPAVFVHAGEATHGDLGICAEGDPIILISKSGATPELLRLVPMLRELKSPLIGILGNSNSPLASMVDCVLDGRVSREADALNLAPTCSTTVALGLGDALAVTLMERRGFGERDFARFHPSGQLGRNLTERVAEVMHPRRTIAAVAPDESIHAVVIAMTQIPLGAACVLESGDQLLGIITDGDLRRALQRFEDIRGLRARDVMTANPTTIGPAALLQEAALLMEDRPSQISVLPVLEADGRCVGLLRLHDLYLHRMGK
ncbi:MAG: KpsF/GutQ family sugar-phosphate isomerase [Bryobacteraceae bacterium]